MLQNINLHYIQPIRSFGRPARLFLLMIAIYGIIYSGWQLFFNLYILQRGFNRDFLGLANSMPYMAGLVFGVPIGRLSDRIGRKAGLVIGLTLSGLFMLVQVTFRLPAIIIASAFLMGIFNMLFTISQAPLMVKLSDPSNRTMLFSLNFGLQTIAGAVGALFAGQLPAVFGSWLHTGAGSASAYQAVLITSVLLGTTALIPLWMMEEPASVPVPASSEISHRKPNSGLTSLTIRMIIPQVVIGFGAAILIPYMNVFFKYTFDISDSLLGLLFSLSSLMIGLASIIAPHLATRLGGKVRAIAATQFGSLVFLLLMGFSPLLWLSSMGFLMRSALMNMSAPLYTAFCMEHTPENRQGLVSSLLNMSWNIGWAIGPYVSGVVQQNQGFAPLFITTAILYFLAILITWIFFVRIDSNRELAQIEPAPAAITPSAKE